MSEQLAAVMDIYAAFGRGDVASILERLSDDVRWDEGIRDTGLPYLQPGVGKDHVVAFFSHLAEHVEFDVFEPGVVCEGTDTVIVPVREAGRNRVSGGEIAEDTMIHLWTLGVDGKVAAFRHIGDWAIHERASRAAAATQVPEAGAELSVVGETVTVLQSGDDFEVFELCGPQDSGPPPHTHPWTESYFVLDGAIELTTESSRTIERGGFGTVPAGALHTYRLLAAGTRVLVMTSGSRASCFFAEVDAHVDPGAPLADTLPILMEVAKRNGLSSPVFA